MITEVEKRRPELEALCRRFRVRRLDVVESKLPTLRREVEALRNE